MNGWKRRNKTNKNNFKSRRLNWSLNSLNIRMIIIRLSTWDVKLKLTKFLEG